mmetsp:Transcript_26655/g.64579  ORF Transcript_26655/g.64579 Transcript_26655/m.64579 type:complete len:84 (+) Transcript_26655:3-254(+)
MTCFDTGWLISDVLKMMTAIMQIGIHFRLNSVEATAVPSLKIKLRWVNRVAAICILIASVITHNPGGVNWQFAEAMVGAVIVS